MHRAYLYVYALIYSIVMSQKEQFYVVDFAPPLILFLLLRRDDFLSIIKALAKLNIFILVVVGFVAYEGNTQLALAIFIRSNLVLFFVLTIFYRSEFFEIARVSHYFRLPAKFTLLVYFTLKSIQSLDIERKKVFESIKSRGFDSRYSLFAYKTYAYAIAQIIRKTHKRSELLDDTLYLRGYDDFFVFFLPYSNRAGVRDFLFFALFFIFIVVNIYVLFYHTY